MHREDVLGPSAAKRFLPTPPSATLRREPCPASSSPQTIAEATTVDNAPRVNATVPVWKNPPYYQPDPANAGNSRAAPSPSRAFPVISKASKPHPKFVTKGRVYTDEAFQAIHSGSFPLIPPRATLGRRPCPALCCACTTQ